MAKKKYVCIKGFAGPEAYYGEGDVELLDAKDEYVRKGFFVLQGEEENAGAIRRRMKSENKKWSNSKKPGNAAWRKKGNRTGPSGRFFYA